MNGWMDWTDEWMDGLDGWMYRWLYGWMDEWISDTRIIGFGNVYRSLSAIIFSVGICYSERCNRYYNNYVISCDY